MKLLLDTHAFLWLVSSLQKVSRAALEACENVDNEVYLSVASAWEMQLKHQAGRLDLDLPLAQLIREQVDRRRLQLLSIHLPQVVELGQLPAIHADPFDRLLIAQARVENAHLVTADAAIRKYPVKTLW